MGQFRSTYVSPHAQSIVARIRVAPAASKATGTVPATKLEPAVKVDRVTRKVRKAIAAMQSEPVGNGSESRPVPVGNAARQAKWRAQHPEQHRDQMRTLRAKRKGGKAGAR